MTANRFKKACQVGALCFAFTSLFIAVHRWQLFFSVFSFEHGFLPFPVSMESSPALKEKQFSQR